jgi:hypothetical protein
MVKVRVIVNNDKYYFRKTFELDCAPEEDWLLKMANGRVTLKSCYICQDFDQNFIEVNCKAKLEDLAYLYLSNTGWEINDLEIFENDSAVHKAVKNIERDRERIARLTKNG